MTPLSQILVLIPLISTVIVIIAFCVLEWKAYKTGYITSQQASSLWGWYALARFSSVIPALYDTQIDGEEPIHAVTALLYTLSTASYFIWWLRTKPVLYYLALTLRLLLIPIILALITSYSFDDGCLRELRSPSLDVFTGIASGTVSSCVVIFIASEFASLALALRSYLFLSLTWLCIIPFAIQGYLYGTTAMLIYVFVASIAATLFLVFAIGRTLLASNSLSEEASNKELL